MQPWITSHSEACNKVASSAMPPEVQVFKQVVLAPDHTSNSSFLHDGVQQVRSCAARRAHFGPGKVISCMSRSALYSPVRRISTGSMLVADILDQDAIRPGITTLPAPVTRPNFSYPAWNMWNPRRTEGDSIFTNILVSYLK